MLISSLFDARIDDGVAIPRHACKQAFLIETSFGAFSRYEDSSMGALTSYNTPPTIMAQRIARFWWSASCARNDLTVFRDEY